MCGITGIHSKHLDIPEQVTQIKKMISVLLHRGPDNWGYYASNQTILGHTRLSIVDISAGHQPMLIDDHVISFNGEIYNYIELKKELESLGVTFHTSSDTEVLLRAFIKFGTRCFEKLNGQFAVLIWDKQKRQLTIARDRFGIRPLYYLNFEGTYYFTSEMKAFDQIPGFYRSYNPQQLFMHGLLWNTSGNQTVYQNIKSLPGGSFAVFENGELNFENQYYELGRSYHQDNLTYKEAEESFMALLTDAVKIRLRSDVPVGAYLSGGIDSSAILSLISDQTKNSYKTFSIAFEDKEYDESPYQLEMAARINTEHHAISITYDKVDKAFPESIYHTERPVFRTAPTPLFLLSEKVNKEHIKVVLTGEGADEILWGYDSFKEVKLLEFWSRFPDSKMRPLLIKKLYPHLNHYSDENQYGMMRMFYEDFIGDIGNELASGNIRVHNNKILQNYFNKSLNQKFDKGDVIADYMQGCPTNFTRFSSLQKNQYLEIRSLLTGYLLSSQGDRMSLAHSVEGRYPFLDHRVIDMLFTLNEGFKLKGFNQKYLLKKAFASKIPESILNRPKRPYMSPDLKSFIRNGKLTDNAAFFMNDILIKDYQIFNPKWVTRFLKKFENGVPENIGYRDNMIITFILSAQIAQYWAKHPRTYELPEDLCSVEIVDYMG
ncbi:asparagine synthase (glutamine-hydrolyzing) [Saccharicrinis sp. FJH54]|uniref:asparagine synthase (glutamine-hydrolyzing) n=1 Tax=Saccharicrinis sp. FJH54 TaxID=3344665 RepID=UPI0035D44274